MDNYYNSQLNGRMVEKEECGKGSYTVLSIDPESDFDLSGNNQRMSNLLTVPIHPFQKKNKTFYHRVKSTVKLVLNVKETRKIICLVSVNVLLLFLTNSWCSSSDSIALRALMLLLAFEVTSLLIAIISIVYDVREKDKLILNNYKRSETLLVFSSLIFIMVGTIFILKECLIRSLDQPPVIITNLFFVPFLLFSFHIIKMLLLEVPPLVSVYQASSSSLLQEHISDMSNSICSLLPPLSRIFKPRMDPFLIMTLSATMICFLANLLIEIDSFYFADTIAALLIAATIIGCVWPLATCSGLVLLNTIPPYVIGQLDKLLSEAQTLDGVLEIRNEKIHTVALSRKQGSKDVNSFGLILCGRIDVRVRRDSDVQMVLAHVYNKLSQLIGQLTIQVIKDEWSTPKLSASPAVKLSSKPVATVAPYQPTSAFDFIDSSFVMKPSHFIRNDIKSSTSSAGDNIVKMFRNAGYKLPPSRQAATSNSYNIHHFNTTSYSK